MMSCLTDLRGMRTIFATNPSGKTLMGAWNVAIIGGGVSAYWGSLQFAKSSDLAVMARPTSCRRRQRQLFRMDDGRLQAPEHRRHQQLRDGLHVIGREKILWYCQISRHGNWGGFRVNLTCLFFVKL